MAKSYGFNMAYTYRQLPDMFYHNDLPDTFLEAEYALFNDALAESLQLDYHALKNPQGVQFLLGNTASEAVQPLSMAYAGHQYGRFTILGDGRAHLLLEHHTEQGLVDVHLKGSGQTAFSRGFDGRATLRSALLEYLMSEAMHALGIPTTRSLAVIKTKDQINRIGSQDAAVLVRVAKSHLRVGTFEYAIYKEDPSALTQLADYAIARHDNDLMTERDRYLLWYKRVIKRQARLIAHWQSIGFVHGVMNTDNMTISGETIDYGPCAFIDGYDLKTVYSSIDHNGRYAYGNQPYMGSWNLAKLGQMILSLVDETHEKAIKKVQDALGLFGSIYEETYYGLMAKKLGLSNPSNEDIKLIDDGLNIMAHHKADYTSTFRALTEQHYPSNAYFDSDTFHGWEKRWKARLEQASEPYALMRKYNPVVIPRNHRVKEVLDQATYESNFDPFNAFLKVLQNPYDESIPEQYKEAPKMNTPYVTYCGT